MDHSTYCCTSRASEGRGSSLTFGKSSSTRTFNKSWPRNRTIPRDAKCRRLFDCSIRSPSSRKSSEPVSAGIRGSRSLASARKKHRKENLGSVDPRYPPPKTSATKLNLTERSRITAIVRLLRLGYSVVRVPAAPNKAPEPTAFAVTPRAISRISEMKLRTENRHVARGAPSKAVAHL